MFIDSMAKTITIRKKVYEDLIKIKNKDESFSELFERLIKSASAVDVLRSIRGNVEFKKKRKMITEIYSKRNEMRI